MSKIPYGIQGPVIGKIGSIVGSSWKGIPYIKSISNRRSGKAGPAETANRMKFAMAHRWLQPVLNFVREGFRKYSPTVEGFLAAKSWLLRHAFEELSPDAHINPALAKLSHGTLPLPEDISAEKTNDGQLHFSWNRNLIEGGHARDQAMLLAYDIEHAFANFSLTGQFRETGSDLLRLPVDPGRTYHLYFAFLAHDRSRQSDSVYLGTVSR
jgi:hypothetical protein